MVNDDLNDSGSDFDNNQNHRQAGDNGGESERQAASFACNGEMIAHFRKKRGYTQKEAAKNAGYSERLIRKAEASGRLSLQALEDLAAALSTKFDQLRAYDLITSPESMVREFWSAYKQHEAEMVSHVQHFLHHAVEIVCAGDPQQIPFAGTFQGPEGLDQWIRTFFATLSRPDPNHFQPEYLASGKRVVTWGEELAVAPGLDPRPMCVIHRFDFDDGKLVRFENMFDTHGGGEYLAQSMIDG